MVVWWRPRANRESCKTCLFCPFQRMRKSCIAWQATDLVTLFRRVRRCAHVVFAWQAWHFVTFHVCQVQDCREAEVAVPMGKVTEASPFRRVRSYAHGVLRGRPGTLWHSTCVRCKTVGRLKLPCLWEKSQNRLVFDVSEAVLMAFCVAGVALCDIPRVSGARLSWGWSCRAYGKSHRSVSFSTCQKLCSWRFCVADLALCDTPHFTLHTLLHTLHSTLYIPHFTLQTLHFTLYTHYSTLHTFHAFHTFHTSHTLHSTLHTPHSTRHTPHLTLHTLLPHFTLHTSHSTLHTLYSTF